LLAGDYFSDDLQVGDKFEWEMIRYIDNGSEVTRDEIGWGHGIIISIEIIQNLTNIESIIIYEDVFDYFYGELDGVASTQRNIIFNLIYPVKEIIEGVETNFFENNKYYVIDGNIAIEKSEYIEDSDNYQTDEKRFIINTGLLQLLLYKVVIDEE
jgi:hypothetical protein